jgi:RNA polymerase sigma factor (sigma-70 family)
MIKKKKVNYQKENQELYETIKKIRMRDEESIKKHYRKLSNKILYMIKTHPRFNEIQDPEDSASAIAVKIIMRMINGKFDKYEIDWLLSTQSKTIKREISNIFRKKNIKERKNKDQEKVEEISIKPNTYRIEKKINKTVASKILNPEEGFLKEEESRRLEECIGKLEKRDAAVVKLIRESYKDVEIAVEIGVTPQRINQIKKEIVTSIQDCILENKTTSNFRDS